MYAKLYVKNKIIYKGKTVGYTVRIDSGEEKQISRKDAVYLAQRIPKTNVIVVSGDHLRVKDGSLTEVTLVPEVKIGATKILSAAAKGTVTAKSSIYRDFTDFKVVPLSLGGVSKKIVVEDADGSLLMLKFAKDKLGVVVKDYLCEYIGSSIAKVLGYKVQDVELGYYNGEECVAVKLFSNTLVSFKGLGTSSADGVKVASKGKNYDLEWLLSLKMKEHKFKITQAQYRLWVWRVFMLDMFIGNFDRHEGNWGFFEDGGYVLAPLYDNGACFYPKLVGTSRIKMSDREIKNLVEFQTKCAILYNGKNRTYFELMNMLLNDPGVKAVFLSFLRKVDSADFSSIFSYVAQFNVEYVDSVNFIKRVMKCRRELLRRYEK